MQAGSTMSGVGRAGVVVALGAVTVATTAVVSFVLPAAPVRMARSSAELIPQSSLWRWIASLPLPVPTDRVAVAATVVLTAGLAMVAYGATIAIVWGRRADRRLLVAVLAPAAVALAMSATALPTQSSDVVDYLLSGRVAAVHDADPLTVSPDAFPDDPLLPYASGQYTADPEAKPPVWLAGATAAAALTAESSPANAILVTRLLFLGLTVANGALIAAILHRRRPDHLLAGLVVYLWSPIVLLHGQAKFDTLMATFVLLAGLALVKAQPLASVAALWLSVMVKLLSLPVMAVSVLGDLAARRWRRLGASAAIVVGVTVALSLPAVGGWTRAVTRLTESSGSGRSLPTVVALAVVVAGGAAVVWAGWRPDADVDTTLRGWAVAALVVAPLALTGASWYLVMPIAVVSLVRDVRITGALVGVSALALLVDSWGRMSNPSYPLPEPLGLSRAALLAIGAGALLAAGVALVVADRARRRATGATTETPT